MCRLKVAESELAQGMQAEQILITGQIQDFNIPLKLKSMPKVLTKTRDTTTTKLLLNIPMMRITEIPMTLLKTWVQVHLLSMQMMLTCKMHQKMSSMLRTKERLSELEEHGL